MAHLNYESGRFPAFRVKNFYYPLRNRNPFIHPAYLSFVHFSSSLSLPSHFPYCSRYCITSAMQSVGLKFELNVWLKLPIFIEYLSSSSFLFFSLTDITLGWKRMRKGYQGSNIGLNLVGLAVPCVVSSRWERNTIRPRHSVFNSCSGSKMVIVLVNHLPTPTFHLSLFQFLSIAFISSLNTYLHFMTSHKNVRHIPAMPRICKWWNTSRIQNVKRNKNQNESYE